MSLDNTIETIQCLSTLSLSVSNTITRAADNLGRNLSLSLNDDYKSLLHYDDVGRLAGVAWQMPGHASAALYHYVEGSDLSAGWSLHPLPATGDFAQLWEHHAAIAATPPLFTHERGGYDLRGLVGEVANSAASSHRYDHDALGRRTARADSGAAYPNAAFDLYGYNARSEVTSGKRYYGGDTADTTRPYGGRDFGYQYDAIGNRLTATVTAGDTTLTHSYSANELNQYAAINNPAAVGLRGEALSNATVTVNQTLAASDTPPSDVWPWHFALDADNATGPDFPHAEIIATLNPPTTNDTALLSTQSGHLYAPPQEEGLLYDDDGNLIQDTRYRYIWDAENRLIAVEERISPTNRPLQRVEYDYDHQSRRTARRHYTRDNASWQLITTSDLVYDGWNEIAETTTTDESTLTNYYVWGADLSGSLQGAGGIGGLIAATIATNQTGSVNLAYGYDANGNVTVLLAGGNEIPYTLAAAYEYDPFGRLIAQRTTPGHETLAKANPFRFSTKYWDNVTGLGYWGYRWYSPEMGRWLNRDPIKERGGLNLFRYCRNTPLTLRDALGKIECHITYLFGLSDEEMKKWEQYGATEGTGGFAKITHFELPKKKVEKCGQAGCRKITEVIPPSCKFVVGFHNNTILDAIPKYAQRSPRNHEELHVKHTAYYLTLLEQVMKSHIGKCMTLACYSAVNNFDISLQKALEAASDALDAQIDFEDYPPEQKQEKKILFEERKAKMEELKEEMNKNKNTMEELCGK